MKKATIKDIAEMVGVSKATVSMVLNKKDGSIGEETKKKILQAAEELNYIPNSIARSLNTRKTGTIGIVLPDILNPFFSQIARAIEDAASQMEYNVIFCNSDNDIDKEEKYVKLLISKLVDGVIFASGGESDRSMSFLKANNIPVVLIDRYMEGYENEYGVFCHNKEGIKAGAKYLYEKGKRKIAFVMGPKKIEVARQRLEGYKEAMEEYNLYNPNFVFETKQLNLEGGMQATEEILNSLDEVDAILYSNDMTAVGGIKVLYRAGLSVPNDISVMGFDNIIMSEFMEPELTTIAQPIYEMGETACRLLIDVIENKAVEKQIYFTPEVVVRGTT